MIIRCLGNRDCSYKCTSRLCLYKPRSGRKAAGHIRRYRCRIFHCRDIHPRTDSCKILGCWCNAHPSYTCVNHNCTHWHLKTINRKDSLTTLDIIANFNRFKATHNWKLFIYFSSRVKWPNINSDVSVYFLVWDPKGIDPGIPHPIKWDCSPSKGTSPKNVFVEG